MACGRPLFSRVIRFRRFRRDDANLLLTIRARNHTARHRISDAQFFGALGTLADHAAPRKRVGSANRFARPLSPIYYGPGLPKARRYFNAGLNDGTAGISRG
jgi:hypothetical protein